MAQLDKLQRLECGIGWDWRTGTLYVDPMLMGNTDPVPDFNINAWVTKQVAEAVSRFGFHQPRSELRKVVVLMIPVPEHEPYRKQL